MLGSGSVDPDAMRTALALVLLVACAEVDDDRADVITIVAGDAEPCLVALPGAGAWHCEGPADAQHCSVWPVCAACEDPVDGWCETEHGPIACAADADAECPPVPEGW